MIFRRLYREEICAKNATRKIKKFFKNGIYMRLKKKYGYNMNDVKSPWKKLVKLHYKSGKIFSCFFSV